MSNIKKIPVQIRIDSEIDQLFKNWQKAQKTITGFKPSKATLIETFLNENSGTLASKVDALELKAEENV